MATETISDLLNIGRQQQVLSSSAALPCVKGLTRSFCWHREHLFIRKEDKVSGILRELLKQKRSVLHSSSAVCICQLPCMAPLKTFQMQVFTNDPGHR